LPADRRGRRDDEPGEALKALGVETIADVVEDTRVLRRLKTHGARHVQGYGIYRPYPLDCFGQAALRVA
jgi:EAL domain-containing protein (putative c-di-GMP-specific phosphodiesterase class I)